jgi:DNA-binding NarL/FixJ family response regulator
MSMYWPKDCVEIPVPTIPDVRVMLVGDQPQIPPAAAMLTGQPTAWRWPVRPLRGEGVTHAWDFPPDLVLMDVRLPGINRADSTRQILVENP